MSIDTLGLGQLPSRVTLYEKSCSRRGLGRERGVTFMPIRGTVFSQINVSKHGAVSECEVWMQIS